MNKLLLALLLSASLAFAWSGSGTYEDPYEIATASDVADLATAVNGGASQSGVYFLQTADIDLSSFGNFTPIGSASAPFAGNYDGDGYILSNLTITASVSGATTNAFGFFGYCENPTLENMSVYGSVKVSATYNANACVGVGGVVGLPIRGLFVALKNYCDIDVKISNAVSDTNNKNVAYGVGGVIGLVGWLPNLGTQFVALENYGRIYVDGVNGRTFVGGCFSANNPIETSNTTLKGFNNFGSIVVAMAIKDTSGQGNSCATLGGIGAVSWHAGSGSLISAPRFSGCSNFGTILSSNAVDTAGVACSGFGGSYHPLYAYNCTNYADIANSFSISDSSGRNYVGGVVASLDNYTETLFQDCVNFGGIKCFGNNVGIVQVGGVWSGVNGAQAVGVSVNNKNFGDIEVNRPNANSSVVGGVMSTYRRHRLANSQNFGSISVNGLKSCLVGGVSSVASNQGNNLTLLRDCANFGSITASGNNSTNYSPCVGGVFASTRQTGTYTRDFVISNCYNLGVMKLNLNADDCYGVIYGVANTYGSYSVSVKNCYAILGEGQNLIGAVDASNGQVSLENCVGIKSGREGGVAYSVSGSNNWSQANTTIVSYEDCYTSPLYCLGNISSGIFFPAEKSTNYFDLILPINTKLYSTPSATDKKNHTYTKAQGYKRYVKTNRR